MIVEFEIGKRKFRAVVRATNEETARLIIYGRIRFLKFEPDDKNFRTNNTETIKEKQP